MINPLSRNTVFNLLRLGKRYGHVLEDRLHPLGLSRSQARVLTVLAENDGLTASDLLPCIAVEPASMTRLLQGLERSGLIQRQPHPTDGRASLLSLTERGRAEQRRVVDLMAALDQELSSVLTEREEEALLQILGRLSERVTEMEAGGAVDTAAVA
jgi:DNA-binding MarR family transcriptional regulator